MFQKVKIEKNDKGYREATFTVDNIALRIIQEAMAFYDESQKGDIDDPEKVKIKKEIINGLHQTWREMNPS